MSDTNTTSEFEIRHLTVINGPVNSIGNRLIATFDVRVVGIEITGFILIKRADGTIVAQGPRGETHNGHKITVTVRGKDVVAALTDRVVMLVEGFTGKSIAAE